MEKKKIKIIAVVAALIIVGLIVFYYKSKPSYSLVSIQVGVAAENQSGIVNIDYPYYTYKLVKGNRLSGDHGGRLKMSLPRNIKDKEISGKVTNELIELVESIKSDPSYEGNQATFDENNYTYRIKILYKDSNDENMTIDVKGYDALPQCWPEFAAIVNDMVEFEALDSNPQIIRFSEDWYKRTFAISDSVFVNGSFSDMVRSEKVGMADIIGKGSWGPMAPITHYLERFTALKWDVLDDLVAHEVQIEESTEEEFIEFADNYFHTVFGDKCRINYIEVDDGKVVGAVCHNSIIITLYRSCEWQPEDTGEGYYAEIDRDGPEGMISVVPAYYSPDGKYVMLNSSNQEKYYKALGIYQN